MPLGDRRGTVRRPLDIDVGVAASRGGLFSPGPEHCEMVTHRRAAEMLDRDADFGQFGVGEAGIVSAIAFDDQADDRARSRIEQPRLDEDRVYRGIEQRVIDDVVEVAVGVVIAPTRRQAHESGERRSGRRPLAIGVRRHVDLAPGLGAAYRSSTLLPAPTSPTASRVLTTVASAKGATPAANAFSAPTNWESHRKPKTNTTAWPRLSDPRSLIQERSHRRSAAKPISAAAARNPTRNPPVGPAT